MLNLILIVHGVGHVLFAKTQIQGYYKILNFSLPKRGSCAIKGNDNSTAFVL